MDDQQALIESLKKQLEEVKAKRCPNCMYCEKKVITGYECVHRTTEGYPIGKHYNKTIFSCIRRDTLATINENSVCGKFEQMPAQKGE